ncbi:MAG: acyl-CoA dehydrogenase family protein [Mycolicibacterium sp.]|uniref:acyl-CoA dehydrogenase family protein n=1 Tax=Mycolicibacterium sp. TaxID=2320850 RepID=UPI003D14F96F
MAEELADQPDNMAGELADQPEFFFTDEQRQLRAAVREFCTQNADESSLRRWMESDPPFDAKVWTRLGTELGVLGLAVPETLGGVGGTLIDQAVAVEELGDALACGPLFGTVYLAVPALVAASAGGETLDALIAGTRTAAMAVSDVAGDFDTAAVVVKAVSGQHGWLLTGTLSRVVDAVAADILLVAANGPEGIGLFAVETDSPGVECVSLTTLDLTRPQANVELADAPARLIAEGDEADRVITHALRVGSALLAVEQVGAARHLLDLSVEYAKNRLQFGRPIGSFQAVKHRLADALVAVEHARSTAYHAIWALAAGTDDPALAVSIAQATCSEAFVRLATDAIQVHGGIGFTWEHQAHLYCKRAYTDAALLGTAEQHRARVAELMFGMSTKEAPRVATGIPG